MIFKQVDIIISTNFRVSKFRIDAGVELQVSGYSAVIHGIPPLRLGGFTPYCAGNVIAESGCYNGRVLEESAEIDLIDERWMRYALSLARRAAEEGEVPVGAVAVKGGLVLGEGYNRKESTQDPTAHAEITALRNAALVLDNWRLIDVTLYSTLEPCPMCAGAMIQARLSRLVYGAKDLRFGADGTVVDVFCVEGFNHVVKVKRGVLESESAALIQDFFRDLRR